MTETLAEDTTKEAAEEGGRDAGGGAVPGAMTEPVRLATAGRLLAHDTFDQKCAFRPIMDQTTSRWATLIISALVSGPHRFAQLHARVGGISQKMLSQNLKALARAGLVHREVAPTNPPQVTYTLTELGLSLAGPLTDLIGWYGAHGAELLAAQERYDAAHGEG
ncbi:winged helix-turn-helix transcriptional regulator [Streptomyces evansiae]|uniref:winged helix-turn-helix transcriptional regulator n=1 Tax=Streptomyces evansiae TaxID=3075535 RepID=UPI002888150F|nr:helix-turn-helix domain-containing protein [Streptomyces sp. DSM 41859]MDT0420901.1 helix-turn-helix domain-containing protein [Streptomyces sp. DSM 41859]